jgi:uncharacterized protein YgfB (UPF0149 family)
VEQGQQLPDYRELTRALEACGLIVSAAEAHGLVCGLLAASGGADLAHLIREFFRDYGLEAEQEARVVAILLRLAEYSQALLEQADFDFVLLLPDDEEPLARRTEALAEWSRGFLYGLTEGGITDVTALPGDAGEVARDLIDISDVEVEEDAAAEEQERALFELEEYIRVGAQLVYEELNAPGGDDPVSLH